MRSWRAGTGRSAGGCCCGRAGGRRRWRRSPRERGAPNVVAPGPLPGRRDRHARRRLHLQRPRRPRHRRAGRAHALAAAALRRGDAAAGAGLPGAAGAGRRAGAPAVQRLRHPARPRLARRRRDLSLHEAHHRLAAIRARPCLFLGRADGLGGDCSAVSHAAPRPALCRLRCCGRSATTRSTRTRTRRTTR